MKRRLLIVNGEYPLLWLWCLQLQGYFDLTIAREFREAHLCLSQGQGDFVLLNVRHQGEEELEFLRGLHQQFPTIPVIIIKGIIEGPFALRAISDGAKGLLEIPLVTETLIQIIAGMTVEDSVKDFKCPEENESAKTLNSLDLDSKSRQLITSDGRFIKPNL